MLVKKKKVLIIIIIIIIIIIERDANRREMISFAFIRHDSSDGRVAFLRTICRLLFFFFFFSFFFFFIFLSTRTKTVQGENRVSTHCHSYEKNEIN